MQPPTLLSCFHAFPPIGESGAESGKQIAAGVESRRHPDFAGTHVLPPNPSNTRWQAPHAHEALVATGAVSFRKLIRED